LLIKIVNDLFNTKYPSGNQYAYEKSNK